MPAIDLHDGHVKPRLELGLLTQCIWHSHRWLFSRISLDFHINNILRYLGVSSLVLGGQVVLDKPTHQVRYWDTLAIEAD